MREVPGSVNGHGDATAKAEDQVVRLRRPAARRQLARLPLDLHREGDARAFERTGREQLDVKMVGLLERLESQVAGESVRHSQRILGAREVDGQAEEVLRLRMAACVAVQFWSPKPRRRLKRRTEEEQKVDPLHHRVDERRPGRRHQLQRRWLDQAGTSRQTTFIEMAMFAVAAANTRILPDATKSGMATFFV